MQNQTDQSYREGSLPASAPLANPFVPFQQNNPPQYEAKKGLVRGTLFPGLDLPFLGMINHEELPDTPLAQLQTLMFAVHELALYLDTHQDDQEAFALYRKYQEILEKKQCLSIRELAVNGADLIADGRKQGKEIGETLKALLELVLEHPEKNTKEKLLEEAHKMKNPHI